VETPATSHASRTECHTYGGVVFCITILINMQYIKNEPTATHEALNLQNEKEGGADEC